MSGRDIPDTSSRGLLEAPEVFAKRIGVSVSELDKFTKVLTAEGSWRKEIRRNEFYNCDEQTDNWSLIPKNGVLYV